MSCLPDLIFSSKQRFEVSPLQGLYHSTAHQKYLSPRVQYGENTLIHPLNTRLLTPAWGDEFVIGQLKILKKNGCATPA